MGKLVSFKQQQRWLLLRARPCECIPHRHFWPGVRWCWEWNAGALCMVGGGLLICWSVKSFYIDPSWISSVKLIIPAACNASKEMVGAFPCLCAAIVSQRVMQNDQGKDPHSRRNSSCIRVAITSMDSGIYIDVTSMSGLSLISINCHVSEISGFQCWLQQYHPISV